MAVKTVPASEYLRFVESKIRKPVLRDNGRREPIGMTYIAATHGTDIDSVVRLARDGEFSGGIGDPSLEGAFHVTPNLGYKGWKRSAFADDIIRIRNQVGSVNTIEISREYATNNGLNTDLGPRNGVVITFGGSIIDLVRHADVDSSSEEFEPEVVLRKAPSLVAIQGIYPADTFSANALQHALVSLRA